MFSQKRAEVPSKITEPYETTKVLEDFLLFQTEDINISDEKIVTQSVVSEMTLGTTSKATNSPLLSSVTLGMISKRVNSEMSSQLTSRKTSNTTHITSAIKTNTLEVTSKIKLGKNKAVEATKTNAETIDPYNSKNIVFRTLPFFP